MGRHSGNAPKTDMGPAFQSLAPENKAAEFDSSHEDPRGYAERNFPQGDASVRQQQWDAVRAQQCADQEARRFTEGNR